MSALFSLGVPMAIRLAERLLGRGKGSEKKSMALAVVKALASAFAGDGVGLPQEAELSAAIEETVAALNSRKALAGESTVVAESVRDEQLAQMGVALIQQGVELLKRGGIG